MHTQLRLAKRQGLLSGPRLSPVQTYGSVVLDAVALRERAKREDRELRLALLSSGLAEPSDLFDEFKEVITDDSEEFDDGVDAQGNPVSTKYVMSNAASDYSQAEVERQIAEMLAAAANGTASFEDEPTFGEWI